MKFVHKTKQIIQQADMFSYPISLRHKDESDKKSLIGAGLTLVVVALFIYLFYTQILDVFYKNDNTITTYYDEQDPPSPFIVPTDIWNFAVQIVGVNMSDTLKYFDFNFYAIMQQQNNNTIINLPLVACDQSYWIKWGFDFQYKNNNFGNWYCLPDKSMLKLSGKPTASSFDYCQLVVTKCTKNCQNQSAINSLLAQQNNMIQINFFYLNMVMNSDQVYTLYFDDSQRFKFNPNSIGIYAQIFMSRLVVTTDESIYPWNNYNVSGGALIDTAKIRKEVVTVYNDTYLVVRILKSSRMIYMNQVYVKITDLLSYIGGLMSLVMGFVQFLIVYYNQVCFYIDLGEDIFQLNPSNNKQPQVHASCFNFLYYLVYMLNRQLNKIRLSLGWRKIDKYKEVVEQVQENIDIKLLLQKLMYLERVVDVLLTEEQQKLLHKYNKQTIQYSKLRRETFIKQENHQQTEMKIFSMNDNPDNTVQNITDQISKNMVRNKLAMYPTQQQLSYQDMIQKENKLPALKNYMFDQPQPNQTIQYSGGFDQRAYDTDNNKL